MNNYEDVLKKARLKVPSILCVKHNYGHVWTDLGEWMRRQRYGRRVASGDSWSLPSPVGHKDNVYLSYIVKSQHTLKKYFIISDLEYWVIQGYIVYRRWLTCIT